MQLHAVKRIDIQVLKRSSTNLQSYQRQGAHAIKQFMPYHKSSKGSFFEVLRGGYNSRSKVYQFSVWLAPKRVLSGSEYPKILRWGFTPDTTEKAYSAPLDLAVFRGGRAKEVREWKRKREEKEKRRGRDGDRRDGRPDQHDAK